MAHVCFTPTQPVDRRWGVVVGRPHILPFQFTNECSRNANINSGSEWEKQMKEEERRKIKSSQCRLATLRANKVQV